MRRKVYGSYQQSKCPFCGKIATAKNKLGISVCRDHTKTEGLDIKCTCGAWLDIRDGKFGTFFLCENCGPISMSKGMEIAGITQKDNNTFQKQDKPKELNISTDDVEYF